MLAFYTAVERVKDADASFLNSNTETLYTVHNCVHTIESWRHECIIQTSGNRTPTDNDLCSGFCHLA